MPLWPMQAERDHVKAIEEMETSQTAKPGAMSKVMPQTGPVEMPL